MWESVNVLAPLMGYACDYIKSKTMISFVPVFKNGPGKYSLVYGPIYQNLPKF